MKREEFLAKATEYYCIAIYQYFLARSDDNVTAATLEMIDQYYERDYDGNGFAENYFSNPELQQLGSAKAHELGIINFLKDDFGPDILRINESSFSIFRKAAETNSLYAKFLLAGDGAFGWLISALRNIAQHYEQLDNRSGEQETPRQEEWSPTPFDRNDPKFIEALKIAEEAIKSVEENNGYATTDPEERNGIIKSIRGNLEALKSGTLPKSVINSSLITPFKYLAKKFGDSLVGQLAIAAAKALANYFGFPI